MNLKPLYRERYQTILSDYTAFYRENEGYAGKLEALSKEEYELLDRISKFVYDENMAPNNKYIEIDMLLGELDKLAERRNGIGAMIRDRRLALDREMTLFVDTCLEAHPSLSKEELLNDIGKKTKKQKDQ
jgi:hypothetical protein